MSYISINKEEENLHQGGNKKVKKRVMLLGNCVANRLQYMLPAHTAFADSFEVIFAPMIHTLREPEDWKRLAVQALSCDIIFTQPLFNFGPCNTDELRQSLRDEQRLEVFSSPDFTAYFPDAITMRGKDNLRFAPVMDWDSSIIFSCYMHGVSIFDVEDVYLNHYLFKAEAVNAGIAQALENYRRREQGVELSTEKFVILNYRKTKLFHSPKHPVDSFLRMMLGDLLADLGCGLESENVEVDGFGFNQWPVITRHHKRYSFPEQAYFIVAGEKHSLEDVAMAFYNFYKFHPHVAEGNQDKIIEL